MTGNDVYKAALAFLMEEPNEDRAFSQNATALINAAISRVLTTQNSREAARNESLTPHFKIQSLEDEIPLDEEILSALSLFLAAEFFRDDLNDSAYREFRKRFEEELYRLSVVLFRDVEDLYGGEC